LCPYWEVLQCFYIVIILPDKDIQRLPEFQPSRHILSDSCRNQLSGTNNALPKIKDKDNQKSGTGTNRSDGERQKPKTRRGGI
jgi:hypothetical protein